MPSEQLWQKKVTGLLTTAAAVRVTVVGNMRAGAVEV